MAKVKTEQVTIYRNTPEEFKFRYDINVDKEGIFSTTLPKEFVEKLNAANVSVKRNRLRNEGYLYSSTLDGLSNEVKKIVDEYTSRELISEKLVIRYNIQTFCSYCFDKDNNIVPSASPFWTKLKDRRENDWQNGTVNMHAQEHRPFGIQVYVKPFYRREYKYKSGTTKIEYDRLSPFGGGDAADSQINLKWLEALVSISEPEGTTQEIDYTEDVAKFFVGLIKGICAINIKIKDFLTPEAILQIAESGGKFLG